MWSELRDRAEAAGLLNDGPRASYPVDHALAAPALLRSLHVEGYFQDEPGIPRALLDRCVAAIDLLDELDLPPVGAFLLDPFWELLAPLDTYATTMLAPRYRVLPAFWAWKLAGASTTGWPPHRDRPSMEVDDDGVPPSITLWVALTDATPANGCMYVVPAPWDVEYRDPDAGVWISSFQCVRAVPAAAGSVLGWSHALLHWGGAARPGEPARRSVSFELVVEGAPVNEAISYPPRFFPSLAERAPIVAEQVAHYHKKMFSHDARYDRLVATIESIATRGA